ncbi:hypothetical protein FISHEDRAFT_78371 [Fistulina hepatica ATCC 64428]|nr:hypothetical protein FISHEDRAFT_78371 [Fistulina hepatica ATCC 64428]
MPADLGNSVSRVPSLVLYCQRVARNHIDELAGFGCMDFDLIEPILENCTEEQLRRLEQASPHICEYTDARWKALCYERFPTWMHQEHDSGKAVEPQSWRNQFNEYQAREKLRLDDLSSKMRIRAAEHDQQKKDTQVTVTDTLPPAKRPRWGNSSSQVKTLFGKTLCEASKIQQHFRKPVAKTAFSRTHVVLVQPGASLLPPPPSTSGSRVHIVNTVIRKKTVHAPVPVDARPPSAVSPLKPLQSMPSRSAPAPSSPSSGPVTLQSVSNVSRSPLAVKKTPFDRLFMPKPRVHSQRAKQ